jgi:hypothetical protein
VTPTPQRVRQQRLRLLLAVILFGCLGLSFLAVAVVSVFGSFLWTVLVGR